MQNMSTGMLAMSVPVVVLPSPPRLPSWKIQTIAPNVAVSENTLSTSAFTGSSTEPVSRNNRMNVVTTMTTNTSGRWSMMLLTLSMFCCARPLNNVSAGAGTSRSASSWS